VDLQEKRLIKKNRLKGSPDPANVDPKAMVDRNDDSTKEVPLDNILQVDQPKKKPALQLAGKDAEPMLQEPESERGAAVKRILNLMRKKTPPAPGSAEK